MNLARDGFTHEQIKNALHAKSGTRTCTFRYELQQDGARVMDLDVSEGSVALDSESAIQRSASITIHNQGIRWLKHHIKIYMGVQVEGKTVEFPLGVFVPSTPIKQISSLAQRPIYQNVTYDLSNWDMIDSVGASWAEIEGVCISVEDIEAGVFVQRVQTHTEMVARCSFSVECYDQTIMLKEDAFTVRYFIQAHTKYQDAIQAILVGAGIENTIVANEVDTKMTTDREFDIGTSKLDLINTLLEEINFLPLHCDENGNFIIKKYVDPEKVSPDYRYTIYELSVIENEATVSQDFYNVPNVFIAVASNPDAEKDFRSVYINDNPASQLSTVQRGRKIVTVPPYKLDAVASQEELDAFVKRKAFEANQIYEELEFQTALMPFHGSKNVLELQHPEAQGLYQETAWSMELKEGGSMQHRARKVVIL